MVQGAFLLVPANEDEDGESESDSDDEEATEKQDGPEDKGKHDTHTQVIRHLLLFSPSECVTVQRTVRLQSPELHCTLTQKAVAQLGRVIAWVASSLHNGRNEGTHNKFENLWVPA
jgi:hypothetical protein